MTCAFLIEFKVKTFIVAMNKFNKVQSLKSTLRKIQSKELTPEALFVIEDDIRFCNCVYPLIYHPWYLCWGLSCSEWNNIFWSSQIWISFLVKVKSGRNYSNEEANTQHCLTRNSTRTCLCVTILNLCAVSFTFSISCCWLDNFSPEYLVSPTTGTWTVFYLPVSPLTIFIKSWNIGLLCH